MTAATTAFILRRLTLGATNDQVDSFADAAPDQVIRQLLDAEPLQPDVPTLTDDDDFLAAAEWWLSVMRRPEAGFHERMVWFWHGHLTSGINKSSSPPMLVQLTLLRTHALGNFGTMLREITLDPAMLYWLDGSGSDAAAPNENYARELMELFALGRDSGAYTEDDVKAGAKALAGYWVDDENDNRVVFEREGALRRSVDFLGRTVRTVDDVIDAVCDHPACARHIARKMHIEFLGTEPDESRLDELADIFRSSDLEIRPLVEAIVTHPSFLEGAEPRPRSALEWFLAFERLVDVELEVWTLETMGQVPLNPPNVAGWPGTDRWVSSGMLLIKAQAALDNAWDTATLDAADPVADVLRRAALYDISDETRRSLDAVATKAEGRREMSSLLHATVALCPEFSIS